VLFLQHTPLALHQFKKRRARHHGQFPKLFQPRASPNSRNLLLALFTFACHGDSAAEMPT
jgi:hypothetical protein